MKTSDPFETPRARIPGKGLRPSMVLGLSVVYAILSRPLQVWPFSSSAELQVIDVRKVVQTDLARRDAHLVAMMNQRLRVPGIAHNQCHAQFIPQNHLQRLLSQVVRLIPHSCWTADLGSPVGAKESMGGGAKTHRATSKAHTNGSGGLTRS